MTLELVCSCFPPLPTHCLANAMMRDASDANYVNVKNVYAVHIDLTRKIMPALSHDFPHKFVTNNNTRGWITPQRRADMIAVVIRTGTGLGIGRVQNIAKSNHKNKYNNCCDYHTSLASGTTFIVATFAPDTENKTFLKYVMHVALCLFTLASLVADLAGRPSWSWKLTSVRHTVVRHSLVHAGWETSHTTQTSTADHMGAGYLLRPRGGADLGPYDTFSPLIAQTPGGSWADVTPGRLVPAQALGGDLPLAERLSYPTTDEYHMNKFNHGAAAPGGPSIYKCSVHERAFVMQVGNHVDNIYEHSMIDHRTPVCRLPCPTDLPPPPVCLTGSAFGAQAPMVRCHARFFSDKPP